MELRSVLQPIVDVDKGEVMGHEALLRGPAGSKWESPAVLFADAARRGQGELLEAKARSLALARLHDLPQGQRLFINIDTLVLNLPVFPHFNEVPRERIVLEISEMRPIIENRRLLESVQTWKEAGFCIAIDDYGAGYMGLGAIFALKPDMLKLDRVVTAGAQTDEIRRVAIRAVLDIARKADMMVIAEGIETHEEYCALHRLGIRYMQGYYFGRPQDDPLRGPLAVCCHQNDGDSP